MQRRGDKSLKMPLKELEAVARGRSRWVGASVLLSFVLGTVLALALTDNRELWAHRIF